MIEGLIDVVELNGDLVDYISLEGTLLPIGPKGDKGDKGDDGFSPQVDITKVGKATTLTIVDQQGTHQSVIYDGDGDMNKSVYDTDNDGVVDNAEKVNNHTVLSDVPSDAQFTDTTYTAGTGIEITAGNIINNTQTSAEWGNITGDIGDQTDLQTALSGKADAATTISGYGITDAYTKTEVNTLIGQLDEFKIQVVETLPVSDIDTHTIYLVPKTGSTGDVYDEYLYINNAWELIGSTSVDLTNYPTFTDYPTAGGKAGVIKNGYSLTVGNTGLPSAEVHTYYDYNNRDTHIFVSKGTLDNVLTGKDYATNSALTTGLSGKQDTLTAGSNVQINNNVISATDTTYQSLVPTEGGTQLSLCTTGEKANWNNKSNFSGNYNDLSNKPTIPDELADLLDDSTHRVVSDTEKSTWSGKQDALVSGTNIKTVNNTSLLGSGNIDLLPKNSYNTSTTDTYSCDYVNNLHEWKYLGEKTGTTSISLPSSFDELLIYIYHSSINQVQVIFNKSVLSSTAYECKTGYYITSANCCGASVSATTTNAYLNYVYIGSADKTSQSKIYVYYR